MYINPDGKLDPEASVTGYRAVAVPGTVAGLELALKTYGSMKLADVMEPAIRLAEKGFAVDAKLAKELEGEQQDLAKFPLSRRIFLNDGKLHRAGETFRQPELAATLKRIAAKGSQDFYHGGTARVIVEDMQRSGGLITMDDLAHYKPKVREALHADYQSGGHQWTVLTSPPPSSGGVAVIEALNMLKDVPIKAGMMSKACIWSRKRCAGYSLIALRIWPMRISRMCPWRGSPIRATRRNSRQASIRSVRRPARP
jgi:gamma-glutamyltranspeptidase/glutathione hydrolase